MKPNPRRKGKAATGRIGKAASGRVGKAAKGKGEKAAGIRSVGRSSSVTSKQKEGVVDTDNTNDHECGICKQPFTDPRLLHCMHTFCNECILQLLSSNNQQDVVCPMCRFVTKGDGGGALQLCRNHVIQQKVKWNKVAAMRDNGEIKCSDCDADQATNLCIDCQWKLCDFCTTHHKRSTRYKVHSVQNIEGVSNEELFEKEPILCSQHQLEIKYFCDNCETTTCVNCVQSKPHQGHVFQPIGEVMESRLASLKKSLNKSDEVCMQYDGYLNNLAILHKMSVEERTASKKRIEDAFAELINVIQEEKQKLFNWLDEKCDSSERALKLAKERVRHVQAMSQYLKDVSRYPKEEMFDIVQDGVTKWDEAVGCMKSAVDLKPIIPEDAALHFSGFHLGPNSAPSEEKNEFAIEIHARQIKVDNSFADRLKQLVRTMCQLEKKLGDSAGFTFHEATFPEPSGEISFKVKNVTQSFLYLYSPSLKIGNLHWRILFKTTIVDAKKTIGIYVGPLRNPDYVSENPNTHVAITLKNQTGVDFTREFTHHYTPDNKTMYQERGYMPFLSWNDLSDPRQGYITSSSVTVHARIHILSMK